MAPAVKKSQERQQKPQRYIETKDALRSSEERVTYEGFTFRDDMSKRDLKKLSRPSKCRYLDKNYVCTRRRSNTNINNIRNVLKSTGWLETDEKKLTPKELFKHSRDAYNIVHASV